jgi:hypothetical protein
MTPHDAVMILLLFGNSGQILIPELVTYGYLVTRMNMAEHERFTQYKRNNHLITYFTID